MDGWRVNNQVIVVAGASKGIGFAAAKTLLDRGAKVALLARDLRRLEEAASELDLSKTLAISVDVCDKDALKKAFNQIQERWGRVDGLINNVGFQFVRRIEIMSEAEIRQLFDLNFLSAVFGCQCAIPIMRKNGGGRIINISSSSVRYDKEFPHLGVYSACKAAVDRFTAELRTEVKQENIMVTLFSPGSVVTGSIEKFDKQALAEATQIWLDEGPYFDGAIVEADTIGEAIAHCFEYPPGVNVEFMEVRPNLRMQKMLESGWDIAISPRSQQDR